MFTTAPPGCEFRLFTPVTPTDVIKMVRALPDKQCSSDSLPTWLLKASAGVLAPFLCHLFNWSFEHGEVPSSMKAAYITPIVKKSDMDPMEAKSYGPIVPTIPRRQQQFLRWWDILHALDTGNIALLTLLDLSAAFNSVDHRVLRSGCRSHTVFM